jgi:spore coat protein U-like protein
MRKMISAVVFGAALIAAASASHRAEAADASATAAATIEAPIGISKTSDLEFGAIAPTSSAGTVTVTTAGARSGDANVSLLSGDTPSAATFSVSGAANAAYSVTVPGSATLSAQGSSGGADMTATLSDDAPVSPALDGSGAATINVGGALAVGADQAADTYSGTFTVTVAYN